MKQIWHDLLFAHWPIAPELLRAFVPAQLPLDTFEGQCWVGVIPFWMSGVRPRGIPPIPGLSELPELNVRTYVVVEKKPGVYFFSLDAGSRLAVWGARTFYHLPYFFADMRIENRSDGTYYSSQRVASAANFSAHYHPISAARAPVYGSLDHWLTERYCLYTVHGDNVYRCEIHHPPWSLQQAHAEIEINTMAEAAGITLPHVAPLLHFSGRQEVLIWPLQCVGKQV